MNDILNIDDNPEDADWLRNLKDKKSEITDASNYQKKRPKKVSLQDDRVIDIDLRGGEK